jgi:hypothetical protein
VKHPPRKYTVYVMTAAGQYRLRFASVKGVRTFLRHRAQHYRSPHHAVGFDASFFLDGISLEEAGFYNQKGYCREKTEA